ncbi:hypothetical protein N6H14_25780 [Paenibacillus sp. CC-CFT747]|nr:hypothetical protein N6H14_25780 [Paenibacillus sp. CC-CFT747]
MERLEKSVQAIMEKHRIVGLSAAVVRRGKTFGPVRTAKRIWRAAGP